MTKFQKWLRENTAYRYIDDNTTIGGRSGLPGYLGLALLVVVCILGWHYQ